MMVIPSITTLQGQLEGEATGMGLTVLNLNKVPKIRTLAIHTLLGNPHLGNLHLSTLVIRTLAP